MQLRCSSAANRKSAARQAHHMHIHIQGVCPALAMPVLQPVGTCYHTVLRAGRECHEAARQEASVRCIDPCVPCLGLFRDWSVVVRKVRTNAVEFVVGVTATACQHNNTHQLYWSGLLASHSSSPPQQSPQEGSCCCHCLGPWLCQQSQQQC